MFGEWTKFILLEPLTKAMYCRRRKWLHASIEKGLCPYLFFAKRKGKPKRKVFASQEVFCF